ncbi:ABC transporter ATP-binding protein [Piscinibacter sakaiensis]|uniref:Putative glutathione transporter, ATP-binding component n=1 Tax=Piscinibacter sakaiensis TaxID=1547922 RepID=A0A0K8P6Q5_PISS1|nr:ABC transporter ATP-binding protein [Piscinibacter sakaiensis]GAP38199.1 putative glutathione transporter, ATP-binding component [Piscinibacter sakaiensis]
MIATGGRVDGGQAAAVVDVDRLSRHFQRPRSWLDRLANRATGPALRAVDEVSFAIPAGKTFALVGESGCGKSTLARTLVGLYRPTAGTVRYGGSGLHRQPVRGQVQMIFQDPFSSLDPRWRAAEIIAEPIRALRLRPADAVAARVDELLTLVGLSPEDARKYPHQFSGGQRQRISIARALAGEPRFLVCDEPTSALDVSVQAQILNLLRDLQVRLGLTYLFISHNLAVVRHVADEVGVMYLGRIVERAETRALFEHPRHPYTRMLLASVPDLGRRGAPRERAAGEVASLRNAPTGCAFHPRCRQATERCRSERPEARPAADAPDTVVACHLVD